MHNLQMWLQTTYYNLAGHGMGTHELQLTFRSSLGLCKSYILHQIKSKTDIVNFLVKILGCKVEAV